MTMRTYGVNPTFRFVEGIWIHRNSRQIRRKKKSEWTYFNYTCATCSEIPSYISTMICTVPSEGSEEQGQAWSSGAQVSDGLR